MTQANTIDIGLNQSLTAGDFAAQGGIAPGLLRVLRQAVALRLVMAVMAMMVFSFARASGLLTQPGAVWLPWMLVIEAAAFLVFVLWDRVQQALRSWFLPAALGWFLVVPLIEQALIVRSLPAEALARIGRDGLPGIGFEALFMVIPVILATWQYGRRGLLAALGILGAGQILLTPLAGSDAAGAAIYLLGVSGRLAMIALLGYVVLQLVNGLRSEHLQLVAANRQLAQRAATVEQLAEIRERNRLARELHDTLAHSLTGLSVQLKALDTLMTYDPDAARGQLKEAQATVRSGIQESRRAIQALRATPLEDLGLSEALRQLCDKLADRTGLDCGCDIAEVGVLDPLTEQAIYRVAETALNNVEQHAAANEVSVSLALAPEDRVRLEVRDNGVGFDLAAVPQDRYGLAGMIERAELIGAALRVDSAPGKGTEVVLEAEK